jgi:uncharacterized protein (TIGR02145 family)
MKSKLLKMVFSIIMLELIVTETSGQITLNLRVFLEGPFSGSLMNTNLNSSGMIPLNQPYNIEPWNYFGTENLAVIPNANIIDWVLVELRETAGGASSATQDKKINQQAALITSSGNIVGLDGINLISYAGSITSNLYVVIWHRNHLAVMSSASLPESGGVYTWDFTDQLSKAYLSGQKSIGAGIFGMVSGDSDANGIVETADIDPVWQINSGKRGYYSTDLNLDIQVNNLDKDSYWINNYGLTTKLPVLTPFICGDAITDIDGNLYNTVLIGSQCWMKENLKTTTYRNGNAIPNVTSNIAWQNLSSGAYVWYNNDISWKNIYGALYIWYTVVDPNGLCPTGWHVPTHNEWTALSNYIGGTNPPHGNELKSCRQVNTPLGGDCLTSVHPRWEYYDNSIYGTDNYGFSGLPGGNRTGNGYFFDIGNNGYWWSSTESTPGGGGAKIRYLLYYSGYVEWTDGSKSYGQSVRCLKDNSD